MTHITNDFNMKGLRVLYWFIYRQKYLMLLYMFRVSGMFGHELRTRFEMDNSKYIQFYF